jgi:methylase of polypeptide subunit release factors
VIPEVEQGDEMVLNQNSNTGYVAKLRQINSVLVKSQQFPNASYSIRKAGLEIVVFRNVFSPGYFEDSEYFAEHLPDVTGLSVLEIGTGTGLIAVKCALGKAKTVVATDINGDAVANALRNVSVHGVESTVVVRKGNIFEAIRKDLRLCNEKFDLIFWNIPFCYLNAELKREIGLQETINELEKSVFNPYYHYLYVYLNEGFDYLSDNGRLLLGFSPTIGRADRLNEIANSAELIATPLVEDTIQVEGAFEKLQLLEFKKKE